METTKSIDDHILELRAKQNHIMNVTRSTLVGGFYTSESLDRTVKSGAKLISDWVDHEILIELLEMNKDGKL